ncbi:MAG: hypothetical protein JNM18_14130 [Planctomycetaceae bacterium]|nr:hypothetical protein [Planctomycetaceae bacterium]
MTSRWLSIFVVLLVLSGSATAQTRVAIPRSALTSPDAAPANAPPAPAPASASTWKTTPILAQTNASAPANSSFAPTPQPGTNNTQFSQPAAPQTPAAQSIPTQPIPTQPIPASTAGASSFPANNSAAPSTGTPSDNGLRPIEPLKDIRNQPRKHVARVSQTSATLPNEAGQVWREYDITPYTARVTSTNRPEQAIIDWVLRETGYETWHSDPLGILSANSKVVRVYHTPEKQAIVADVIDRFVSSEAESQAFGISVVTISNPNWRINAQRYMQPIAVQTQGIQAWMMRREDAALVMAELRRRGDFREHSAPQMLINNGQSAVVNVMQAKQYTRNVVLRQTTAGVLQEPELAQFDEGFALEMSPLMGLDGRTIDAVLKCQIDQLEKLVPVMLDAPSPLQSRQRMKIEVPQATHFRLHERFRWPSDQVLVVGLGMVATPTPQEPNALLANLPLMSAPPRADLLVFVEGRGKMAPGSAPLAAPALPAAVPAPFSPLTPATTAGRFNGRY